MTKREAERWAKASRLAVLAMGKRERRHGGGWNADHDPLACWLLTEAIYNL